MEVGDRIALHLYTVGLKYLESALEGNGICHASAENGAALDVLVLTDKTVKYCGNGIKHLCYRCGNARQQTCELLAAAPLAAEHCKDVHLRGKCLGRCDGYLGSCRAEEMIVSLLCKRRILVVRYGSGDAAALLCVADDRTHVRSLTRLRNADNERILVLDLCAVFGYDRRRCKTARQPRIYTEDILSVYGCMVARSASCEADVLNALRLCVRDKRTNGLAVYLFKSGKNSGLLSDFFFKIDHNKTPYAAQAEKN